MAERAAHLVDHVFPDVPVRQWVLSHRHKIVAEVLSGREDRVMCAALTVADAEREAVFTTIKQRKGIPAGLYLLSYFDEASHAADDSEPHYVEVRVGPIRTLQKCREIENLLREGGIGFRGCRAWEPPSLSASDE